MADSKVESVASKMMPPSGPCASLEVSGQQGEREGVMKADAVDGIEEVGGWMDGW